MGEREEDCIRDDNMNADDGDNFDMILIKMMSEVHISRKSEDERLREVFDSDIKVGSGT